MENETIEQIPVEDLHVFRNHTFQVKDDEAMKALMESIKERGIVLPLLAFTNEDGEPELISGHRRLWVARELRLETVPVIMKKVDRPEATLLMGISNFMNRQKVLPSERGFTYAAMLKALKADKNRENGTARDLLAKRLGEDARQISRFIRLTELIPDLLKLVDAGKLGLRPASELSYLSADTQAVILRCPWISTLPKLFQEVSDRVYSDAVWSQRNSFTILLDDNPEILDNMAACLFMDSFYHAEMIPQIMQQT